MSNSGATSDDGIAALRPLSACVAGAGVMTLGVLQFLGQLWNAVPDPVRQEMLVTVRVAFLGFLLTLGALVLGWLGKRTGGALWRGAITLFGLTVFAASAYGVALGTGRALGKALPSAPDALPADEVLFMMGAGATAFLALAATLLIMAIRRIFWRPMP